MRPAIVHCDELTCDFRIEIHDNADRLMAAHKRFQEHKTSSGHLKKHTWEMVLDGYYERGAKKP